MFIYKIQLFFGHVVAYLAMRAKVAEARSLFRKDGQRRFIVPFINGEMEVLTKQQAKALKKENHLASDLSPKLLYNACFFFTDTNDKTSHVQCEMPKREFKRRMKSYYKWYDRHHSTCI